MKDLENLIEQTKKIYEKAIEKERSPDKANIVELRPLEIGSIQYFKHLTTILADIICNFAFKKNEGVIMQLQTGRPNEPWRIVYNYDGKTVHMESYDSNKHAHIKVLNKPEKNNEYITSK